MGSLNPVRIRLRYAELETFVERFAPNVTRGGVFLATRNQHPVGSTVAFEIQLANGYVALAGEGTVAWVREWNPSEPNRPHGMGVRFVSIEARTRPVLARLLRVKETTGSGPSVRRPTVPLLPLADQSSGQSAVTSNGRPSPPPVDTGVDLAAELGVDPSMVRSLIERTWLTSARAYDDLTELLEVEPIEPATLSQALAELPRFLELPSGRRRTQGGLRTLEGGAGATAREAGLKVASSAGGGAGNHPSAPMPPSSPPPPGSTEAPVPELHDAAEITDLTVVKDRLDSATTAVVAAPPFVEPVHEAASGKSQHH